MKAVTDISRLLFFLFSLIALVAAAKVSAVEQDGALFDAVRWLERQKVISTKEVIALRDLVTIKYDENVGRPWGDFHLRQETTKRWAAFRKSFCPAVKDLCLLSENAELSSISQILKQESTLRQINARLSELGSPVSIVRLREVPALLPTHLSGLNDFNFVIGVITRAQSSEGPSYGQVEDTVLMDVGSYYLGFQRQPPPVYVAIDNKNQLLVFEETLIAKALEIAPLWQKSLNQEIPQGYLYLPNLLIRDYAAAKKSNSKKYDSLKSLQGIEWLIYDDIKALSINQGLYLQRSWSEKLSDADKEMTVRRALLQLQKDFDMRLISLLFLQQSYDQNAVVIEQYTPVPTVNTIIRENINALLSAEGFKSLAYKKQWFTAVDLKYVQEPDFLKEFNLDLYEALENIDLLDKDLSTLSAGHKRALTIAAIYPKNMGYPDEIKSLDTLIRTKTVDTTYINKPGMYRVFAMLVSSKDLSLLSKLSDEIYAKRFPSL